MMWYVNFDSALQGIFPGASKAEVAHGVLKASRGLRKVEYRNQL